MSLLFLHHSEARCETRQRMKRLKEREREQKIWYSSRIIDFVDYSLFICLP